MQETGGFLGTAASFNADLILVGSVLVALMMTLGAYMATRRQYEAHRWIQSIAVGLNAVLVAMMIRALLAVDPAENVGLPVSAFVTMTSHEIIGGIAVLFGVFVTLRGNELVPQRFKFTNYKLYMRWAYGLYMLATVIGIGVYIVLYV
jgi:uncharacterized membrane protein YozB (DUF420 family)